MLKAITILGTASILCGCSSPSVSYYTLQANADKSSYNVLKPQMVSVLLQPVEFPEYLDTKNIVTRLSDLELKFSEEHSWAESFDVLVTRYVYRQLQKTKKSVQVIDSTRYGKPHVKLKICIERFEMNNETGNIELVAYWHQVDGATNKIVSQNTFRKHKKATGDYASSAALHSELLNELVVHIADNI